MESRPTGPGEMTLDQLIQETGRDRFPGPAGGTAAAVSAALGAALLEMSARVSLRTRSGDEELTGIRDGAGRLARELTRLAGEDITAYGAVIRALPGKKKDPAVYHAAMTGAAEVLLSVGDLCLEALDLALRLRPLCRISALGDLLTGSHLLLAALESSLAGAEINRNRLKDPETRTILMERQERLRARGQRAGRELLGRESAGAE